MMNDVEFRSVRVMFRSRKKKDWTIKHILTHDVYNNLEMKKIYLKFLNINVLQQFTLRGSISYISQVSLNVWHRIIN